MEAKALNIILISIGLLLADFYILKGVKGAYRNWKFIHTRQFRHIYWTASILLIIGLLLSIYVKLGVGIRAAIMLIFFLQFFGKVCFLPFIALDDLRRLVIWLGRRSKKPKPATASGNAEDSPEKITRSEFLMKTGMIAATAAPVGTLGFGILNGAYDYHVRQVDLYLPNLPKAFDGIRLGQISDIHSGSFYNKKAVTHGVEMLLNQKPDFIFFTGDLVNARTKEMYEYQDIFSKIKAPLGVFSSTGNHDYGDYATWPSVAAKRKNFEDLITTHKNLGWDLLMNENRRLKVGGEEIGILGIENWGALSRFPKYGKMELAVKNTDDLPVKLLLSHDPSHWRAEVLPKYPQIDAVFAGHTHGMQFGIRTQHFQWSPIKFVYPEWAGLYRENNQQIYVNVGYGFLGYPGRVGILPEITIFTLRASVDPAMAQKA